eukprot:gene1420-2033_t
MAAALILARGWMEQCALRGKHQPLHPEGNAQLFT